jgi:MFS family permease
MRAGTSVLRHTAFRRLFAGQSASALGDGVVLVALALFVVRLTGSATDLGLILGAQTAPFVVLLLLGGVWADRLPRRLIMIGCDLARALLHAGVAILILTGSIRVWELAAIEALYGAARAFFQPAYTGLLPQTVPEPEIQDAWALTALSQTAALLLGPSIATALVLGVGAGAAFAVDAGSFVLSAVFLLRVRTRERGAAPAGERESLLTGLRVGYREVSTRPWVWVTIVCFTGVLVCVYAPWNVLAPLVARDHYGGAGVYGVLSAVFGAGALCAALAATRWRPARPLLTATLFVFAWPLQGLALALRLPLAIILVLSLGAGFGSSFFQILWDTALAHRIPPHALSRVSSYDWMGSLALYPIGLVAAGPLAGLLGGRVLLGGGALLGLVLTGCVLLPRESRSLRSAAPEPGASAPQPSSSRAMSA